MAQNYTPEQRRMLALARQKTARDSRRIQQSLLEAMLVESGARNLNYGDRDSQGVLQQRPSQGWGEPGNPSEDIDQYLARARALERQGFKGTPGQLAQAIQRSAYPGRYDERAAEVAKLLGSGPVHGGGPESSGYPMEGQSGAHTTTAPDLSGLRKQLALSLIGNEQPADTLAIVKQIGQARAGTGPAVPGAARVPSAGAPGPQITVEGKVTPRVAKAVGLVREAVGTPYVWGGEQPGGFDCSGLLQYAWAKQGVKIPRVTYDQWQAGSPVGKGQLRAGDAVFFRPGQRGPEHVGMYIGNGRFIEAPGRGKQVRISQLKGRADYIGARRFA